MRRLQKTVSCCGCSTTTVRPLVILLFRCFWEVGGRDGGGADDGGGGGGVVEAIETLVEGTISIQTSSVSSTSLYVRVLDKCTWVMGMCGISSI